MKSLAALLRAGAALGALLVLVVALPALMWTFGAPYLPDHLPSVTEISTALSGTDTGQVFLGMLVIAGFIAWAQLTLAVGVEILGLLRGRSLPRIRGLGWARPIAGVLLAAVITTAAANAASAIPDVSSPQLRLSDTTSAAPAHVPLAGQAMPLESTVAAPTTSPAAEPAGPATPADTPARHYTVQPGDSLMRIATEQLGNESRYREIFELNQNKSQADGHALTTEALILPGWVLELPADPAPASPVPVAGRDREHVVDPGDSLSQIAQTHLGDARRYAEIFELNRDKPQPSRPALTDPDLLRPGMVLHLPRDPSTTVDAAPAEPHPPTAGSASAAPPPANPPSPSPSPSITETPSATPSTPALAQTPCAPTVHAPPEPETTSVEQDNNSIGVALGVGGLLAAGILATLGTRRWIAHRRRRPGHRMAHSQLPTDLEMACRNTEQPDQVDLLDRSLRTLAHRAQQQNQPLPAIRSAVLSPNGVSLHPTQPSNPAWPFTAGDHGQAEEDWTLDSAADLLPADQAQQVSPPYPALITLGHDPHGALVLVNLEHVGAITLAGPPVDVQSVLAAMAADLAVAKWADHLTVTLVGTAPTLAAHLPDRLRYAATIDEALDAFTRRSAEVTQALNDAGVDSVDAARGHCLAEDTWSPDVLLSAQPFTAAQLARLTQLVNGDGPATGLAAVITASSDHSIAGAWQIDAAAGPEPVRITPLNLSVRLQRLTSDDLTQLVCALAAASDTTQVPAEDYRRVPPETQHLPEPLHPTEADHGGPDLDQVLDAPGPLPIERGGEDSDGRDVAEEAAGLIARAPEVRVLGPVDLAGVDHERVETKKRNRLIELAAFLALHPGACADEISRRLGTDDRPWSQATRQGSISRLRTWLGRDPEGQPYFPTFGTTTGYALHEDVRCDWHRFHELTRRGLRLLDTDHAGLAALEQALNLVRGMPFSNIPAGRYHWADFLRQEMIDAIVDVAHTVATTHLHAGNLRRARTALARGLMAEPVSELLYRDLLRVEHRGNNRAGVRTAADRLTTIAQDLDIDLEPETSELLRQLRDPRHRLVMAHQTGSD